MKDRTVTRRVFPAVVTVTGLAVAIAAVPVESPQAGANMWARSLSEADRISYMRSATLRTLPVEYRHALFATLNTADERAEFWRQVFRDYQREHDLSEAQQRVLSQTAQALLTPAAFQLPRATRERPGKVAAAKTAIAKALGAEAEQQLFVTAGPVATHASNLPVLERLRYAWRAVRPKQLVALVNRIAIPALASSCNCINSGECSYYQYCAGVACDATSWGCGSWWCEACTGICGYS